MKSSERRRAPRRRFEARVALKTERAIFFVQSIDLSEGGIRVRSEVGLSVGTKLRLVPFFDDSTRLFEASGVVVRSEERASLTEMGVRFEGLGAVELEALLALLSREATTIPAESFVAGGRA